MTIPNTLTLLRILLTPFICLLITLKTWYAQNIAFILFVIASLTDFFDGYVAEKTNSRSVLGAFLDPLADKILIILVFFFLASSGRIRGMLLWPCTLIIGREIIILSVRGSLGAQKLPVIRLAQWKTALQTLGGALLLLPPFPIFLYSTHIVLWGAAILGCWSGYLYGKRAFRHIEGSSDTKSDAKKHHLPSHSL